jgi:NADH:ubiquinone oxidoreductase subunit 6 (subunit J)
MHCQTVIESMNKALCVAFLIASVIPVLVMPYRIFQAFVTRARNSHERGEHVYNHIFAWLVYFFIVIGVVFSLHMLEVLDSGRVLKVGIICACLLGCLFLFCYLVVAIYGAIVKWRSRK